MYSKYVLYGVECVWMGSAVKCLYGEFALHDKYKSNKKMNYVHRFFLFGLILSYFRNKNFAFKPDSFVEYLKKNSVTFMFF
jgi:hypothetical protein